ncbi:MAG: gluconate 2-dehydrogenase subunit 3 family protein [Halioglobus sp.]
MDPVRRKFLKESGIGIVVATIAGPHLLLSPAEAKAKSIPPKILSTSEFQTLEAVADVLLPGSVQAGVVHFIDEQLTRDPNDCLLVARYFHVEPPYAEFYKASVRALDAYAQVKHSKKFDQLNSGLQDQLVGSLFPEQPEGWQGPPSPAVYLCLRNDVVDSMYGTMEGFAKLGIPYLAHIEPPANW